MLWIELSNVMDISFLRLPLYHCDLNPIENVLGMMKTDVSRHNNNFKLNSMKNLVDEAIGRITVQMIRNTFGHGKKNEKRYGKQMACWYLQLLTTSLLVWTIRHQMSQALHWMNMIKKSFTLYWSKHKSSPIKDQN